MASTDDALRLVVNEWLAKRTTNDMRCTPLCCKDISLDESERSVTSIITREILDRDGEVVRVKGLNFKNFKKNPVVLFMHDMDEPVGQSAWQRPQQRNGAWEVVAKTIFAETDAAEEVFGLSKANVLRGISVGMNWRTLECRQPKVKEIKDHPHWKGCKTLIVSAEVLEYSHVTIPACPEALVTAVTKGYINHTAKHFEPFIKAIVDANPRKKPFVRVPGEGKKTERIVRPVRVVKPKRYVTVVEAEKRMRLAIAIKAGRA